MSLLKTVFKASPLAAAAFVKWVTARDTLLPYKPFLRRSLDELPTEMIYGVVKLFMSDSGIQLVEKVSLAGRHRPQVFQRRLTGTYKLVYRCRTLLSAEDGMRSAIVAGFRVMEKRLEAGRPSAPPDEQTMVLIGADVDAILEAAHEKMKAA